MIHLLTVRHAPFFSNLYIDPLWYDEWGQRIAAGQLLSEKPFFLDPLYPYMLGAIFATFGHHYEAVVAVQSVLGALVAPLVFLAALRWFDAPVARVAGLIAALYVPAIYFGGLLMKPGLSLFLSALALWLLAVALRDGGLGVWIGAGATLGLAGLTRGNLVLVLPVLGLWLLGRALSGDDVEPLARRLLRRERWKEVLALTAGAAAILILPAIHNYKVGGELILTTANAGANFYIGNNPSNDSGEYQQFPFIDANPKHEQRDFAAEAARRSGRSDMTDREISAFWFGESRRWIGSEPGAWLGLLARKVRSFWGAYEIPDSLDYYLVREHAPVLRLPLPGFGLLAPLALTGIALALRRRGWPRLLLVFVAAYAASIVAFFVFSRFRMVIAPALYVFAAYAAVELIGRGRGFVRDRTAWRPALAGSALLLVFLVFVNVPVRARTDSWGYRLASSLGLPVRAETSALGHYNLGLALARRAKLDEQRADVLLTEAERRMRTALELQGDVGHGRVQVELGKVLARRQRNREAIELYREAARLEPNDYRIWHSLGLLYTRENDLDAAAAAFREALRIAPGHAASATRLGTALLGAGRREEAAQAFRHALRLSPDNRVAREGLQATGVTN